MIPTVFISSTISDLQYLRDGLREAVEELQYRPIMSDYGEVGYISPTTAADSCYRSIKQCQLVVLIVGRKYGSFGEDGLSVTHREFLTARGERIPTITFVDPKVLSYKEVYTSDPGAAVWDNFKEMDNPRKTFALLDDVAKSESFNAIIPFTSASDAKQKLKLQIADFVGDRLNDIVQPARKELQEILAEVKTLRRQLGESSKEFGETKVRAQRYLTTMRFLLEDKNADFRKFIEALFRDLDAAIDVLIEQKPLAEAIEKSGYRVLTIADADARKEIMVGMNRPESGKPFPLQASFGQFGGYAILTDKSIKVNETQFARFQECHAALMGRLNQTK